MVRRLFATSLLAFLVGCGGGDSAGARTEPVTPIGPPRAETAATGTKLVRSGVVFTE